MQVDVRVRGIEELKRELARLARPQVPVATGALRTSIKARRAPRADSTARPWGAQARAVGPRYHQPGRGDRGYRGLLDGIG